MLRRIIALNTTTYGKAILRLDDCNSIQLVGPNNVGKSTLIFTLNFLFIIDGKKMTFGDDKTGDKETIHHYFPSPVNSFIIFEIFKHRYYCILLKRNNDGEIEYFKFDSEYKDDLFINEVKNQQTILKFDEIRSQLINSGITLQTFRDKREVFNFVYQRGKRNNGVIWLEDNVMSDGLSNNFSKIYRFLINSKLITNPALKEALIIADNRDKEVLNFSQKSKKDIVELLKVNDEIKAISSIQRDFIEFREAVNQYNARTIILAELIYGFNQQYQPTLVEIENMVQMKIKEISDTSILLEERLKPKMQKLDREIGAKDAELKINLHEQNKSKELLSEVNSFEGLELLTAISINLNAKRQELETQISNIQNRDLTLKQVEQKIALLENDIERTQNQITNYTNQLIHKVTDNQEEKEILNYIFSRDFSSNQLHVINKKINNISHLMNIFDGEIKLHLPIKRDEIPSIDNLKEDLISYKKEKDEYNNLLPIVKDFEASKENLDQVNKSLKEANGRISKINKKPIVELSLELLKKNFSTISKEKDGLEKELTNLSTEITEKTENLPTLAGEKAKLEARLNELRKWKEEIEKININPIVTDTIEGIKALYEKIRLHDSTRQNLKTGKDLSFERLKAKLRSTIANEDDFIRYIEDEISCLSEKQKSVETILQAISTQFANPAYTLLKRYGEFKEFLTNKFNTKLSKIKISDIESLKITLIDNFKIVDDLKKISSIEEFSPQTSFDFDKTENLKVLNKYLDSGQRIEFQDLFDIELHLTKDGKEKKVDLKQQVESTGTDIMVRMVIIMSVINRLAINDEENKITIAIDEIARVDGENRLELFKFCKDHNFIPICTSTEETILDGFEKYILLFRPKKGKKANINENHINVIRQEPIVEYERA